jgi:hypothetical protein
MQRQPRPFGSVSTSSLDMLHVVMGADPSVSLAHDYAIASFRP